MESLLLERTYERIIERIREEASLSMISSDLSPKSPLAGPSSPRHERLDLVESRLLEFLRDRVLPQLNENHGLGAQDGETPGVRRKSVVATDIAYLQEVVNAAIERRVRNGRVTIALVGAVKAGKTCFINAFVGRPVLPSRNRAATAWPTIIRHNPSAHEPILTLDAAQFNNAVSRLRELGIYRRLRTFRPPSLEESWAHDEDDFLFGDVDVKSPISALPTAQFSPRSLDLEDENSLPYLHATWEALEDSCRESLKLFEQETFCFPTIVEGYDDCMINVSRRKTSRSRAAC